MILSIKPENCTGCLACAIYCSLAHEGIVNLDLSRIKVTQDENRQVIVPVVCFPCEEKPCIQSCPENGAIFLDDTGAVIINEKLCTGCSRCVRTCEIGAIQFHRLPGRGKKGLAVSLKCDQCGGAPWCVRVCPNDAIQFVDSNAEAVAVFNHIRSDLELLKLVRALQNSEGSHHE